MIFSFKAITSYPYWAFHPVAVLTFSPRAVPPVQPFPTPDPLAMTKLKTRPPDFCPSAVSPAPVTPWCAVQYAARSPRRPEMPACPRDRASGGCSRWIDPQRDLWRGSPSAGSKIWTWARWRSAASAQTAAGDSARRKWMRMGSPRTMMRLSSGGDDGWPQTAT